MAIASSLQILKGGQPVLRFKWPNIPVYFSDTVMIFQIILIDNQKITYNIERLLITIHVV